MTKSTAELFDLTALQLSKALHQGETTCVAVMEAYLARIADENPTYNAIVSLRDRSDLLSEAKVADDALLSGQSRGWMHGMPIAIKDLSEAAGLPCSWGSLIHKDHVSTQDDLHVARIKQAGAIVIGKTNTPEMGLGSHTTNRVFGPARNAVDPSKSAGGSSGGAGVALARKMLPVADGSDMMGSLRNPAAFNGIYGYRPSFGRIPDPGGTDMFYSQLATSGPMGRTVADMAALFQTMAGYDPRDPLSLADEELSVEGEKVSFDGCRIGWLGDLGGYLPMEPGILEVNRHAISLLGALGAEVSELVPDFDFAALWRCWTTLRSFNVGPGLKLFYDQPEKQVLLGKQAIWEVENLARLNTEDLIEAAHVRTRWFNCLLGLYESYDYLVLPAAQVFPFDVNLSWPEDIAGAAMDTYHRWMEVVIGPSLAGLPVAAVPTGIGPGGLPTGVQLIGAPRADRKVLQLAASYEAQVGRSGLADLTGH